MQFEWLDSFYILMSCVIFTQPWLLRKTTRVTILSNTKSSFIWNCDQFKGGIMRMMINFCQHQQIGSQASSRPFFCQTVFCHHYKKVDTLFRLDDSFAHLQKKQKGFWPELEFIMSLIKILKHMEKLVTVTNCEKLPESK